MSMFLFTNSRNNIIYVKLFNYVCLIVAISRVDFFAFLNSSLNSTSRVSFSSISANEGGGFSSTTFDTFICPQSGLYWMFYTVVLSNDTTNAANFTIIGTNSSVSTGLYRLSYRYSAMDVVSRDHLLFLTKGKQLTMFSGFPLYGDKTMGSSWGGIRLDALMFPLVAFEVLCSFNCNKFENVLLNVGNGWDPISTQFIAPVTGNYYFSGSAAISVGGVDAMLTIGPCQTFISYSWQKGFNSDGRNIISGSCFVHLNKSDVVAGFLFVRSSFDETMFDDFTFRGFLYAPMNGAHIAWYLSSYVYIDESGSFASVTYSYFNSEYWLEVKDKISIIISGKYYIDLSGSSNIINNVIDIRIMLNNTKTVLRLYFSWFNCLLNRNRAAITDFMAGSELSIAVSNSPGRLNFNGFLIYPH